MKAKKLIEQWEDFKIDFPRHLILIQCGVFYETYSADADFLSEISGNKSYDRGKLRVCGFPISALKLNVTRIEDLGYSVVVVNEMEWDGDKKIRGVSYVSGNKQISSEIQEPKREPKSSFPKKKSKKIQLSIDLAINLKQSKRVKIALIQIGYMFNAFEEDAKILSETIGLKSFDKFGFLTVGFPVNSSEIYFRKILDNQLSFLTIVETGKNRTGSIRELDRVFVISNENEKAKSLEDSKRVFKPIDKTSLKSIALSHASNGFYVIPLIENDKRPLISDWQKRATTNTLQINAWWDDNPKANIGIVCQVSNLIIIDLDIAKGEDPPIKWSGLQVKNGEDVFMSICKKHNDLSAFDTYTVITPSGGKHLYFYDQNEPIKQGSEVNGWWRVDTRSRGGYIVAEGSQIFDSNSKQPRSYSSINASQEILILPDWLRKELTPDLSKSVFSKSFSRLNSKAINPNSNFTPNKAEEILIRRCDLIKNTKKGTRHQDLLKHSCFIGKIIASGSLDELQAKNRLLDAALDSGLDKSDSISAIKSGIEYGKKFTN